MAELRPGHGLVDLVVALLAVGGCHPRVPVPEGGGAHRDVRVQCRLGLDLILEEEGGVQVQQVVFQILGAARMILLLSFGPTLGLVLVHHHPLGLRLHAFLLVLLLLLPLLFLLVLLLLTFSRFSPISAAARFSSVPSLFFSVFFSEA